MIELPLRRDRLKHLSMGPGTHPGLMLRRGLDAWPEDNKAGQVKADAVDAIANISPDESYRWAYRRWCASTTPVAAADDAATQARFDSIEMNLIGRLYIGLARESPLETGITVQHTWGMPMIPGSAVKGVCRRVALERALPKEVVVHLFGSAPEDLDAEAGAVVFHDAWWVPMDQVDQPGGQSRISIGAARGEPDHRPFVAEVVTPHHSDYYNLGKSAATDFDNPIPAPQIAAQGRFRFVVEGERQWRKLALALLRIALTEYGIGGKTTSGYGLFDPPPDRGEAS